MTNLDKAWITIANAPKLEEPGFKCPLCANRMEVQIWYLVCDPCNVEILYNTGLKAENIR